MNALPIVHSPDYVTPLPPGHRFPMPKFGLLYDHLLADGLATPAQFHQPQPLRPDQLATVHDPAYVDAFCQGTLDPDALRRIGLPWSPGLVRRSTVAVGGTLLTCQLALDHGLACNTAGGTHHAFPDVGSGFCIFNDMAVAAQLLLQRGRVDQVLIIDLDVHQGDGTAFIFRDEPAVYTFSMHCEKNFPMRKQASDLDVALPIGMGDEAYLAVLRRTLPDLLETVEPDLVIYDAGVDPHADDRLGRLNLTDAGLLARDRFVIDTCRTHHVPTACVIGGGYSHDHALLARRHATVHRAALSHSRPDADLESSTPAHARP